LDTEKKKTKKVSSPDVQLEIDLLEGQTRSEIKAKADPVSSNENTGNIELSKKEKRVQNNED
tara:strand:- start:1759 stop:1944 length:186 start_codon:yes stop_codon:yes gene_type:complete